MSVVQWEKIDLFKDLKPSGLDKVRPLFDSVTRMAGERIIVEGEPGDEMFILISGRVRIIKSMLIKGMNLPLKEVAVPQKVLATLQADSYPIFGEMALLDRDTRSATVEVVEESRFLCTDRKRFYSLIDLDPAVANSLLLAIGRRLTNMVRRNNSEIVKLTSALALALSR